MGLEVYILAASMYTNPEVLRETLAWEKADKSRWAMDSKYAYNNYMVAREYLEYVKSESFIMTNPLAPRDELIEDAWHRYEVWNQIDNISRCFNHWDRDRLRVHLGEHNYHLRILPDPCPRWYRPRFVMD